FTYSDRNRCSPAGERPVTNVSSQFASAATNAAMLHNASHTKWGMARNSLNSTVRRTGCPPGRGRVGASAGGCASMGLPDLSAPRVLADSADLLGRARQQVA